MAVLHRWEVARSTPAHVGVSLVAKSHSSTNGKSTSLATTPQSQLPGSLKGTCYLPKYPLLQGLAEKVRFQQRPEGGTGGLLESQEQSILDKGPASSIQKPGSLEQSKPGDVQERRSADPGGGRLLGPQRQGLRG